MKVSPSRNVFVPLGHEVSRLASPREPDSVYKQWQRGNRGLDQRNSDVAAIKNLLRKVESMRRRMLGGAISSSSGYMGEYDSSKSYSAGQTFKISAANPFLSGLTVKAGFYAVRSSISSDPLGYGPFAGGLPSDPIATAGIDSKLAFFDPDNNGAPVLGTAPNDKIYAEIINEFC